MTKNNRFKKEVRAYQKAFNVPYIRALEATSKPFIVTPDMEELTFQLQQLVKEMRGGMILVTGSVNSGKTYLQHYLANELSKNYYRIIELDRDKELTDWVIPKFGKDQAEEQLGSVILSSSNPNINENSLVYQSLRMAPDLISVPELRDQGSFDTLTMGVVTGVNVLASINSSDPFTVIDRFVELFRPNFENSDSFNLNNSGVTSSEFIKTGLRMVIDVARAQVNGKSLIVASSYVLDKNVFNAWENGKLEETLIAQGFQTANQKKQKILNL